MQSIETGSSLWTEEHSSAVYGFRRSGRARALGIRGSRELALAAISSVYVLPLALAVLLRGSGTVYIMKLKVIHYVASRERKGYS